MKNPKKHDAELVAAMRQVEDKGMTVLNMTSEDEPCEICDMEDVNDPHYGMFGYHRSDCTFCYFT